LRRTSRRVRRGSTREVTERLLSHVGGSIGGIVGGYQRHDFMDEIREAILVTRRGLSRILRRPRVSLCDITAATAERMLTSESRAPLIVDQPEDNLDSEFIYKTLVPVIAWPRRSDR
jgi:hypothetical protein